MPYGYYYGVDYTYLIFVLPALLLSLWAQMKVKSTFRRYSSIYSRRGETAAQVARRILNANGLQGVAIERVSGELTDHYDPRGRVLRLSDSVYGSTSVAAIGVAAHEAGHAVQDQVEYGPMKLRSAIIPVTNFGAKISMPLILIGLLIGYTRLAMLGVLFFGLSTVFQLVTLPVEFNASHRAMEILQEQDMLYGEELRGARKVLTAAALTYVAALFVSFMQLLRLWVIVGGRKDRRR